MEIALERIQNLGPDGYLNLEKLGLTELPPLPPTILRLNCNFNRNLVSLPPLPTSLEHLECVGNGLTSLPPLPTSLKVLICRGNKLTSLPALPPNLIKLNCITNELSNLPVLPKTLESLYCRNNQLTTLPVLPSGIMTIDIFPNPFEEPYATFTLKYKISGDLEKLIEDVNEANARKSHQAKTRGLKENLIAVRFDPKKIKRNMNKNQVDPEGYMSEENWEKYYERRGEVWTEGVGKGGYKRSGYKRSSTRKTKKRQSNKYTRKTR